MTKQERAAIEQQQAQRARRRQPRSLTRNAPTREERLTLLIICQGAVTEVEYFRHFELATADIIPLGRPFDPETLVQEALDLRQAAIDQKKAYDQVWCVFDKDDTEPGPFHAAIQKAQANGLEVAYSNQVFEYWFLLHFDPHPGGHMNRKACGKRVEELIQAIDPRVRYDSAKGKHVSRALFDLFEAFHPKINSLTLVPVAWK